jgi:hypothetical protein
MTLQDFKEADLVVCMGQIWRVAAFEMNGVYLHHAELGHTCVLIASYKMPATAYTGEAS